MDSGTTNDGPTDDGSVDDGCDWRYFRCWFPGKRRQPT
jgi:hypothetical protein